MLPPKNPKKHINNNKSIACRRPSPLPLALPFSFPSFFHAISLSPAFISAMMMPVICS